MSLIGEAGGDQLDLGRELETYRAYLLHVAWRLRGKGGVAGAEGASDLVQQSMLVALRKAGDGKGPGSTDRDRRAWLRQILVNLMREKARRDRRHRGTLEGSVADSATSPSGAAARLDEARAIAEALGRLGPEDRELITWRCVEGLSYEEIGRRRGYSDTYARRVVARVLGRLRSMLEG